MRPRPVGELLRKAHAPVPTFLHAAAFGARHQAARSHVPGRSWAKTVVCVADAEPILAIVPAHLLVGLEPLRLRELTRPAVGTIGRRRR